MTPSLANREALRRINIERDELGARVCLDTSDRLMQAARLLHNSGFLELASFVVCTSIEETGKAFLIMDFQEELFEKRKNAGKNLTDCFFRHPKKLELALEAAKTDELLFDSLKNILHAKKGYDTFAESIKAIVEGIATPDLKSQADETFRQRNEFLYTNFQNGEFLAPKDFAKSSRYEELLDIAEKAYASAQIE